MIENKVMETEISDLACPWCYIGKAFLDEAMEILTDRGIIVNVERNSYLLRDDIPGEGIDLASFIQNQLGGYNRREAHHETALQTRNARIANYKWLANPMNGHRSLIYVRETWKAEHEALEFLYRALYEDGKNISSVASCFEEIAHVKGIDVPAMTAALSGAAFTRKVLEEDAYAKRKLHIQGVPHFYITANKTKTEFDGAVNAESVWFKR